MWMRHKARIALGDMAFGPFGIWLVIIHVGKFGSLAMETKSMMTQCSSDTVTERNWSSQHFR